ncbi:MAG: insulinase family protein [Anaerolineae bacterium]|nr:insulinase family protein [Anaerolineae bacterium]
MPVQSARQIDLGTLPGPDDVHRTVLDNGITVLVRENFASPAVVVQGYLEVGAQDEPEGLFGLAGFTADVMQRGTARRTFVELYEEVESVGAGFGLATGSHISSFGAKGLSSTFPNLLDILADVLRSPTFDARQVEKVRAEIITDLMERTHDTRRMARLRFYELAYPPAHPYHWSLMGYQETIDTISREDLTGFHDAYFSPQGMVVVVVGGIEAERAVEGVQKSFGDWDGDQPRRHPLVNVPALAERREAQITIDDKTQSNLVLGWPGPSRKDKDFVPCFVANTVLGVFGMYGRLGQRVREQNGLAYYVYSKLEGGSGPGPWRIVGGFDPATVSQGAELILDELRTLCDVPIPEEELNDSKSYLTGSLPLFLETNEGVARSLINIERYQLGLDYLRQYPAMIQAVTADQIRDAVCRWIDLEHYALAVAGPALEAAE